MTTEYMQDMMCTKIAVFVLTFRTILVHNMFCRCCELLKKIYLYIHRLNWTNPVRLAQIISRPVPINPNVSDPKEKL